jgi:protein import protein ZIM17
MRCKGCSNLHLIADNIGWFGEEKNVEEILFKLGQTVRRGRQADLYEIFAHEVTRLEKKLKEELKSKEGARQGE